MFRRPCGEPSLNPVLTSAQISKHSPRTVQSIVVHCKNVWVTLTVFLASQLHACCVRDILQNFKEGYHSHSESECS